MTAALLFTIAVGIGSTVTIHSFIRGLTTHRSPIGRSGGLVSVFRRGPGSVSYDEYRSLETRLHGFRWIGAAQISQRAVTLAGRSAVLSVAAVTPALAREFHLSLLDGVVISRRVRQGEFAGKTDVRGERVRIGNIDSRVVGVAPDNLEGVYADRPVDFWMPLRGKSLSARDRRIRNVWLLAGSSTTQPQGEMQIVPYTGMTPETAEGLSRVGTLLNAAARFVFFIACANVASFLLGRAAARLPETSLRVALGARRSRLARAVLSDSIVIAIAGGALGVLLAVWTSKIVPALPFQQDAEFLVQAPDVFGILTVSAAGVGIVIACGLLPLLEMRYDRPALVLQRESGGPSRGTRALRTALVIGQMACCCLLVIAAGLLYEGLHSSLRAIATGRLGKPILATVEAHPESGLRYFRDIERAARSVSGESAAAWAGRLPGSQPAWQSFRIEPPALPLRDVELDAAAFTPDSVAAIRLPPKAGRLFGFVDRGCRVAIVNEEGAEALFGDETIGRSAYDAVGSPVVIIGVIAARDRRRHRSTIYFDRTDQPGPASNEIARFRFRTPVASELQTAEFDTNVVSPNYFAVMGWSVAAGRVFANAEPGGCRDAVVNQEAADLYFGGHAVGAAVIDEVGRRTEIIGVVRVAQLSALQRRAEPTIYFPMARDYPLRMTLILGASAPTDPLLSKLRSRLDSVPGRGRAPVLVKTLDAHLRQTALAPLRIATVISGASAVMAILLGILGLYGTLSDAARRRSRDLAIRIALGARRRDVIGQVLREGGRLAAIGASAGVIGSLLLSQLLLRIVPGGSTPKLWVWLAGPVVLAAAVALASVLPARRAWMVDPLRILRDNT